MIQISAVTVLRELAKQNGRVLQYGCTLPNGQLQIALTPVSKLSPDSPVTWEGSVEELGMLTRKAICYLSGYSKIEVEVV